MTRDHTMRERRIYLASSWRNERQQELVRKLRECQFLVYDFKHPRPNEHGFSWGNIAEAWKNWTPAEFREGLKSPIATAGFQNDWKAMQWADTGVLLLPCGRSAHLEAGYFVGAGKDLFVLLAPGEPELMLLAAGVDNICLTEDELLDKLSR